MITDTRPASDSTFVLLPIDRPAGSISEDYGYAPRRAWEDLQGASDIRVVLCIIWLILDRPGASQTHEPTSVVYLLTRVAAQPWLTCQRTCQSPISTNPCPL